MKTIPPYAGLAARAIVGAVLVYAGSTKAAGPVEEFALVIGSYDVLSKDMVLTMARFLPWVELLLGWSLILGFRLRASAIGCGAMFASFLFALLTVKAKGIELPNCGCFGDAIHLTMAQALAFDSALLALCWLSWKATPQSFTLDSWVEGGYTGSHHVQR